MMRKRGLYDPQYEHDACGVGFAARINGEKRHDIIEQGITILNNLEHRGATGGDNKTGDGAGMLIQIPHRFFSKCVDFSLPEPGKYGVGFIFMPKEGIKEAESLTQESFEDEGFRVLGWREVPVNPECLGETAMESMPAFRQVFVTHDQIMGNELETKLYTIRKIIENRGAEKGWSIQDFYIPSLSSKTVVYKGMFVAPQFKEFYPDLSDTDMESAIALVHQRYSTNTFPSWPLAQPFRSIAHNGEINTLKRNTNAMKARENSLESKVFGDDIKKLLPVIQENVSDSAAFDNVFELLTKAGRSPQHAIMMMIPEAFGSRYHISTDKRAFYEYHASIMEPWDGPAAVAFSNGDIIGATLDRNGLRPGRYTITEDGLVVMASETGVLDIDPSTVVEKGRLAPGRMFIVDTVNHRFMHDNEIKSAVSRQKPYRSWIDNNRILLRGLQNMPEAPYKLTPNLSSEQVLFGYTEEDFNTVIKPKVENSQEPVGSMGNDTPPAVLSDKPVLLFDYFKQNFAQVTNPPIDPYRENLVMSLMDFAGRESNILAEGPRHCRKLKLSHPVLTNNDLSNIINSKLDELNTQTISILYLKESSNLKSAVEAVCTNAEDAVDKGASLIVLSDRGCNENIVPVPSLLATSAVYNHLVKKGKKHLTDIIVESGEPREVQHFAVLIAYGASAVNPYLALETIKDMQERGIIESPPDADIAMEHYITAIKKGLLKIMSKMGISTIRSYKGSMIFDIVGLSQEVTDRYFPGNISAVGGSDTGFIENMQLKRHADARERISAVNRDRVLNSGGKYAHRNDGIKHLFSPQAVVKLQEAVRKGDYSAYKEYSSIVNDTSRNLCTFRGLFRLNKGAPVPLEKVESEESIAKRFVTSAMSFGSISKEAHETMAIAMNRIGAASNSGEGGEDEERFKRLENGDWPMSRVKQVASARFGVSSNYLTHADELQIKMAQGAKPGEGGQLPGHKVNEIIAKVRNSTPGVMLISPPPHHDIYSIEDLAQLIHDLKNANPGGRVSVKLVSESGVGTVAAGVAKGKADMVLISGGDGGTGASPVSSIFHAGSYWEIGLAETQQTLVMNKLRNKIRVQVDGQIKTGRDVVIGALLGAEEFGFGTASLVSMGCVMMRKCQKNTCPVGIATQREELRKLFSGKPEHVVNFMLFTAREVREYMAELGFKRFDDMVGCIDIIDRKPAVEHFKKSGLDFSRILTAPESADRKELYCTAGQNHDFSLGLDERLIEDCSSAIQKRVKVNLFMRIRNYNRTTGTMLSSVVSGKYGSAGLPDNTINVNFTGAAGQSFGAFLAPGITFKLIGEANDYMGKGLSGGRIILKSPDNASFIKEKNIITGNVNLFGATGGEAFIGGQAGERFAVRNSGAVAVVEGVGDHGCEYMTGGRVIIIGRTGVNFAAGMSGGIAYVLDENQLFDTKCNLEMVNFETITDKEDSEFLWEYITKHVEYTGSATGRFILDNWQNMLPMFVKIMPIEYKKALQKMLEHESVSSERADITEEVY